MCIRDRPHRIRDVGVGEARRGAPGDGHQRRQDLDGEVPRGVQRLASGDGGEERPSHLTALARVGDSVDRDGCINDHASELRSVWRICSNTSARTLSLIHI